jgi:hypothetical protein
MPVEGVEGLTQPEDMMNEKFGNGENATPEINAIPGFYPKGLNVNSPGLSNERAIPRVGECTEIIVRAKILEIDIGRNQKISKEAQSKIQPFDFAQGPN